jgi:hypothetical protein
MVRSVTQGDGGGVLHACNRLDVADLVARCRAPRRRRGAPCLARGGEPEQANVLAGALQALESSRRADRPHRSCLWGPAGARHRGMQSSASSPMEPRSPGPQQCRPRLLADTTSHDAVSPDTRATTKASPDRAGLRHLLVATNAHRVLAGSLLAPGSKQ